MTVMEEPATDTWEREGIRLASLIEGISAVVVAGTDPVASASVAVGLARVHGRTRRVAVADLIGNAPPLEALLSSDDPHGISDSFRYGVSLNKVARPMVGVRNVFVMPSGSEPVALDSVYANFRWRRLSAGFQQVDALLIVVALPGTPGFSDLCTFIGALLPVGDTAFPPPPGVPILAPPPPPADAPPPPPPPAIAARAREAAADNEGSRRRKRWALLALYGAGAVATGGVLQRVGGWWGSSAVPLVTTAPESPSIVVAATIDSAALLRARRDSIAADSALISQANATTAAEPATVAAPVVAPPTMVPSPGGMLTVMNPADSAVATKYSVYYATASSLVAALPDRRVSGMPAVAISPVTDGTEQGFRVTIGAFPSRAAADTLLTKLRADKLIASGSVVRTPYAFLLDSGLVARAIRSRTELYAQRAITAYGLIQRDGSAMMYTGAFESPKQAATLAISLRAIGITPVLVYRTGRTF